jgi:hypothetical protein
MSARIQVICQQNTVYLPVRIQYIFGLNTVYLLGALEYIWLPEYSLFGGPNTVYSAARIQFIRRPEYSFASARIYTVYSSARNPNRVYSSAPVQFIRRPNTVYLFLLFNTFTMSGMLEKTKKTNFEVRACAMRLTKLFSVCFTQNKCFSFLP